MGAEKTEVVQIFFVGHVIFVATYGKVATRKKHRPTELFTPFEAMYKSCL